MTKAQKIARIQLQERSKLSAKAFDALLQDLKLPFRHVYEGEELQQIEAALSQLQQGQPAPEAAADANPAAANNALTVVTNGVVSGITAQMQQFEAGISLMEEQASDYMSDRLAVAPRNIAALTATKLSQKVQSNPVSLGVAMEAAFRSFSLPQVPQHQIPSLSAGSEVA